MSGFMVRFVLGAGILGLALAPMQAHASRLTDLIKRPPELYLPTQLIAGREATFTLKGSPGESYKLFISTRPQGYSLPTGQPLRIGEPKLVREGVLPASGVITLPVQLPKYIGRPGINRFAEAVVWKNADQSDIRQAVIIAPDGTQTRYNAIAVGVEKDPGKTLIIPGDPSMSQIIRGLGMYNEIKDPEKRKKLIDDGSINRGRALDNTLSVPGTGR